MPTIYRARPACSSLIAAAVGLAFPWLHVPAVTAAPVVPYKVTDGGRIADPLTDGPASALAGARLYRSAATECAGCHGRPGGGGTDQGPDLAGVGARREAGTLRLWLVAPEVLDPSMADHAYYRAGQRRGADDPLYGGPRLSADEIEDLVAWLESLTWAP